MVSHIPDSVTAETVPLIENTTYRYVDLALNYPYLVSGIILFIVLLIVSYFIFGKSIRVWFKLRKLNKDFEKYKAGFDRLKGETNQLAEIIAFWKKYHEKLEGIPFTKFTTKELLRIEHIKRIENTLKSIDRSIYGGRKEDNGVLEDLFKYSENKYLDKINEVKHG